MVTGLRAAPTRVDRLEPLDAVVALLVAGAAAVDAWTADPGGPLGATLVATVLTTVPLAWRSAAPLPVVVITTWSFALALAIGLPSDGLLIAPIAPMLALYSLGEHAGTGALVAGVLAALAAYTTAWAVGGHLGGLGLAIPGVLGAAAVGRAVRVMGFETDVLNERAIELERDRDAAVADERARIARELHDVIGHSISVMGIQAGAVRRVLPEELERERETLLAVERAGRDAVAEMHRLLGFLRSGGGRPAAAMPTLERVEDLIEEVRSAGLHVELLIDGDLDGLPPGRALAAFRILQEALTNALRHAPAVPVQVTIRRTPSDLEIRVAGEHDGGPATANGGGGHGLVGMRERVALYGGTLEAGRRAGGGFVVDAHLPMMGE
jgi:signal transduction histidine kinase